MLSKKVDRKKKIRYIYRAPIDNTESSNNDDEINSRIEKKVDSLVKNVDSLSKSVNSLGEKIGSLGGKIDNLGDDLGGKIDNLGDVLGKKIDGGFLNLQNFFVKLFAEYFGERKKIENNDIVEKGEKNYSVDYGGKKNGLERISLSSESHKSEQQKEKVLKKAELEAPKAPRWRLSSKHFGKKEISDNEQQKGMALKKAELEAPKAPRWRLLSRHFSKKEISDNEQQKGMVLEKTELDAPKASRRNLSSRHDGKIEISGHYYGKNDTIPSIRRRYIGKYNDK